MAVCAQNCEVADGCVLFMLLPQVIAVSKVLRMYKILREESEAIVALKQLTPSHKVPFGLLAQGPEAIQKGRFVVPCLCCVYWCVARLKRTCECVFLPFYRSPFTECADATCAAVTDFDSAKNADKTNERMPGAKPVAKNMKNAVIKPKSRKKK